MVFETNVAVARNLPDFKVNTSFFYGTSGSADFDVQILV